MLGMFCFHIKLTIRLCTYVQTASWKNSKKLGSRVNNVQKLASTNWRTDARTLKTSSLALIYSTAEYCAPVWLNSVHVTKIDTQLNAAMWLIMGTLKTTQREWLPLLSNIAPAHLRHEGATIREFANTQRCQNSLLYEEIQNLPDLRLRSRKPPRTLDPAITDREFYLKDRWKELWDAATPHNGFFIENPLELQPGFNLKRPEWVQLNKFSTEHGRCEYLMNKLGYSDSSHCDCGEMRQTTL